MSRKRKFVLLGEHLITQRDKERFGHKNFSKRGYSVHFVSCWSANGRGNVSELEAGDFRNLSEVFVPTSKNELNDFFDTLLPGDFILSTVSFQPET